MKVYFAHPRHSFDYEKELYQPLRASALNAQHQFVLPHEPGMESVRSKDIIKSCDVMCAEVSESAMGVGIEIGWADSFNKPILCFYKSGSDVSGSLKFVSKTIVEYSDTQDFLTKVDNALNNL